MFAECIRDSIAPSVWFLSRFCRAKEAPLARLLSTSTAFAVAPTLLACARHSVVSAATDVPVWLAASNLRTREARLHINPVWDHVALDLALLRVREPMPSWVEVYDEADVVPMGSPCALFGTLTQNNPAQQIRPFERVTVGAVASAVVSDRYDLDLQAYDGQSGGPVFLADGRVFAVYTDSAVTNPPLNIAGGHLGDQGFFRSRVSWAADIRHLVPAINQLGPM